MLPSNKKHLSGSEKSKKKKEIQENISKLPKIDNFFKNKLISDTEKRKGKYFIL